MSLLAMQREFRGWLCADDETIAQRSRRNAMAGLRAYQNNYRAQLVGCLEESFGQTRAWIGGEAFHAAIVTHIDRVPPSSWTLDAYGRDFPATLAALYPDHPEVGELAWIDWALGEAFVGPDSPAIDATAAAHVDWDDAILHFTPTLDYRTSTTNAPALWAALAAGQMPPPAMTLPEAGAVIAWRDHFTARFRAIDREELEALLLARSGMSFADMCGALVSRLGENAGISRAGACLGRWLGDGLICRIGTGAASG
jgi:hypothetical protein